MQTVWQRQHGEEGEQFVEPRIDLGPTGEVFVFARHTGSEGGGWLARFEAGNGRPISSSAFAPERVEDMVVDGQGAVLLTGIAYTDRKGDAWLAKYDSRGSLIWSHRYVGPGDDIMFSVAVDTSNAVYIAGSAPPAGSHNANQLSAVVQKVSASGRESWTQLFEQSAALAVAIGPNGELIYGGKDYGDSRGHRAMASGLSRSNGNQSWRTVTAIGGACGTGGHSYTGALAVDDTGAVYATGVTCTVRGRGLLAKYVGHSEVPWAHEFIPDTGSSGRGTAIKVGGDQVTVGGYYLPIDSELTRVGIIASYARSNGSQLWSYTLDDGQENWIHDLVLMPGGDVIAVGTMKTGTSRKLWIARLRGS